MRHLLTGMLACLLFIAPTSANIKYVKSGATGTNNGTSWTNAYTDLQDALTISATGDTIWVASGTYKPVTTFPFWEGSTFSIPDGVAVYGGFVGNETTLNQRNFLTNTTTLSGNLTGTPASGAWHVVSMNNVNAQTRLDGFTISGGYADGSTTSDQTGAGVYISGNSRPVIDNCVFTNNFSLDDGAALAQTSPGSLTLRNSTFRTNSSRGDGGGISAIDTAVLENCNFSGNQASGSGGGAFFPGSGIVTIDRCTFSDNSASNGGAVFFGDYNSSTTTNSLFVGNTASFYVICLQLAVPNTNVHKIINCTIADNKIFLVGPEAVRLNSISEIRNSIVWGNAASSQVSSTTQLISNSVVQGLTTIPNNINSNPHFVNPGNAGTAPFNAALYNYTLKGWSPAIDKGQNSFIPFSFMNDLANTARVFGNIVDIGAYEKAYCPLSALINPGGILTFCQGVSMTISANSGYYYEWSTGATTQSINPTSSGNYIVAVSDSNCRGYDTVIVTVIPAPVPTVVANGSILSTTTPFSTYQWQLNGTNIPGATASTFTPSLSGNYTVEVSDSTSCYGISSPYTIVLGVEDVDGSGTITLFPNPTSEFVNIHFGGVNTNYQLEVYNFQGNAVLSETAVVDPNRIHTIDVKNLAPGMYFLKCHSERKSLTRKFIVQ